MDAASKHPAPAATTLTRQPPSKLGGANEHRKLLDVQSYLAASNHPLLSDPHVSDPPPPPHPPRPHPPPASHRGPLGLIVIPQTNWPSFNPAGANCKLGQDAGSLGAPPSRRWKNGPTRRPHTTLGGRSTFSSTKSGAVMLQESAVIGRRGLWQSHMASHTKGDAELQKRSEKRRVSDVMKPLQDVSTARL